MIVRIFAAIFLMALASSLPAQEQKVPAELPAAGTELFRGLLNFSGVEPIKREEENDQSPYRIRNAIVIVYGKPETFEQANLIRNYVNNNSAAGGSILIAVGEEYDLGRIAPQFVQYQIVCPGLHFFDQGPLTPEELPESQRINCPFVSSKPYGLNQLLTPDRSPEWNPFRGFAKIATNRPAVLMPKPFAVADSLAYLPPGCRTGSRRGPKIPPEAVFAMGFTTDRKTNGKFIVMADEKLLSNQMIAMPGTDNLPFSMKLIGTLKGQTSDERTRAVFFERGERRYQFDDVKFGVNPMSPTPPLPIPPPQVLDQIATQLADGMIDQIDQNDSLNRLLSRNENLYARLMKYLLIGSIIVTAFFLAKRLFGSKYRNDRTAMPIAPLARIKPARGLVGQMRQDVLMAGDYGAVVREYLQDLFAATGLPLGTHERLPAILYQGKAENTPALLADLTKLWTIAYGPQTHIKIADWKNLEPILQRVWRAAEVGRWRFAANREHS